MINLVISVKFDSNKYSIFLFYYHLILVTEYRKVKVRKENAKSL